MILRKMYSVRRVLLGILGTLAIWGHQVTADAKSIPATTTEEAQIKTRIERARDRLINELGAQDTSQEKAAKIAQWYNWPNWGNWFNGWRNW
ncbi:MAG: hypothetical protein IH605_12455 [Burkholderiales bacterium]|nr:hypothetical protein [Burkholderiales bacterium]